jgi:hypothetical protein
MNVLGKTQTSVAKDVLPFLEWKIGCDYRRSVFIMLAEYFEKRFRRKHGGLLDVDGIGVVGESGDGGLVLWKSMSARANVGSGVRIATSELPLRVDDVEKPSRRTPNGDSVLWESTGVFRRRTRSIGQDPSARRAAVAESLSGLDDEDLDAERNPPKAISPTDPCSARTAKANKRVHVEHAVIIEYLLAHIMQRRLANVAQIIHLFDL